MSKSFRQSFCFFFLLVIANVLSVLYNQTHDYRFSLNILIEVVPFFIWVSFVFWVGCQFKFKTSFRLFFLPLIRVIFWTLIILYGFLTNSRLSTEDFLYANNEMFFWWTTSKHLLDTFLNLDEFVELFLLDILLIAIVQLILIYLAILFEGKRTHFYKISNLK